MMRNSLLLKLLFEKSNDIVTESNGAKEKGNTHH